MRTALTFAVLALLPGLARAGEPRWTFHPGQTYTYECRTFFEYAAHPGTTASGGSNGGGESGGGGGGGG